MSLVEHAKSELALLDNDEAFDQCIINAVEAFAAYGHGGGSASVGIHILHDLLQFKNLSALSDDPGEWNHICDERTNGEELWQSARCSEAFSHDAGKTYYLISEVNDPQNPDVFHVSERAKEGVGV